MTLDIRCRECGVFVGSKAYLRERELCQRCIWELIDCIIIKIQIEMVAKERWLDKQSKDPQSEWGVPYIRTGTTRHGYQPEYSDKQYHGGQFHDGEW